MRWAPRRIKQSQIPFNPNHSMSLSFYNNPSGRHHVPGTARAWCDSLRRLPSTRTPHLREAPSPVHVMEAAH